MKSISIVSLFVSLLFYIVPCQSQDAELVSGKATSFSIQKNDYYNLNFTNTLTTVNSFVVKHKTGFYNQLLADTYGTSLEVGNPQLPVLKKLIEVPVGAEINIKVIKENYLEFDLLELGLEYSVFPVQPPVSKSTDNPEDIPFEKNETTYLTDSYYGFETVQVKILGTMRGVNLARLEIAPLKYNPVQHTIRVCVDMEVEISFIGGNKVQTTNQKKNLFSPYFEGIYKQLANYKPEVTDELIMAEPVTYIIVSDPMFQTALQPFIEWKTKKGFNVVEAYTNDPGVGTTTASIKSYLEAFYNTPPAGFNAQSFVLFVGDVAQIPAFSSGGHVTDLYYCTYNGSGDIYPECYYGRFSAENLSELQPQIDKTLEYEQYLMPDPSFLDEVVMVAGADGGYETHSNGQINYGTDHYFNAAHGLYSNTYLQPEPGGGNYSENIRQNVNDGVTFGNYTAHCSTQGWADPGFTISHIPQLTNASKYPLLIGNCCSSLEFQTTCFGEEILRAENKGAIGYIGGSNSTYWDEDYWFGVGHESVVLNAPYNANNLGAYDRTFHDHGEPLSEWYVTQGQMPSAGNLAVTQAGSSRETYYWEIYHLMGDPSLMIYFSQPSLTTANYYTLMPLGSVSFTVNTEPYAYVAISKDGVLHGAAVADGSGVADV
ncbi:MAG: hypothetical protein K8S16_20090, partial [Bacteroidales bacterium]|nr:hypothetical protein [Bacteroidales bacterium]